MRTRGLDKMVATVAVAMSVVCARGAEKPNVLIIGDSISLGYTPIVAKMLADQARVVHNEGNAGATRGGLSHIDEWLGDGKWDVIHFNWGLWDIARRKDGQLDARVDVSIPLPKYQKNLETLIAKMKEKCPNAVLIWGAISWVPADSPGRMQGDEVPYNEAAAKIMQKNGVLIDDLHTLSAGLPQGMRASGKGNVHYNETGYTKLAEQVAASIKTALAGKKK